MGQLILNPDLTPQERDIMELLAWGASMKEVADKLNITYNSLDRRIRTIKQKIGVQKATEIAMFYFCTNFKISFSLSPIKRKIITSIMIAIMLPQIFGADAQGLRAFRSSRARRNREQITLISYE